MPDQHEQAETETGRDLDSPLGRIQEQRGSALWL